MDNTVGISLGNVCKSAIYGVENKLRLKKNEGYKTCPFDLCVSNVEGIIKCFNDDFKDFCNHTLLHYDDNSKQIIHQKYKFSFNHECPYHADLYIKEKWPEGAFHFVNNNYKNFRDRYNMRIQNFRYYCKSNYNIIFILQFTDDKYSDELMSKLNKAIKTRYPNLKYTIKII